MLAFFTFTIISIDCLTIVLSYIDIRYILLVPSKTPALSALTNDKKL